VAPGADSLIKPWIESIDKWFASTNTRHRVGLERAQRERSDRLDADAKNESGFNR
jgi:hypothetical protein